MKRGQHWRYIGDPNTGLVKYLNSLNNFGCQIFGIKIMIWTPTQYSDVYDVSDTLLEEQTSQFLHSKPYTKCPEFRWIWYSVVCYLCPNCIFYAERISSPLRFICFEIKKIYNYSFLYHKDFENLYHTFMYSPVALLSGIYPLPAMHSLLVYIRCTDI